MLGLDLGLTASPTCNPDSMALLYQISHGQVPTAPLHGLGYLGNLQPCVSHSLAWHSLLEGVLHNLIVPEESIIGPAVRYTVGFSHGCSIYMNPSLVSFHVRYIYE